MNEVSIRVEGLGKLYRIGQREGYRTLRDTLAGVMHTPFHRLLSLVREPSSDGGQSQVPNDQYIWALKDVSFQVSRGEVIGIIGANGVGKTTLLKILSRITEPTDGYAEIHGRVGSLLEVGTGFHPELTGRENIYLSGAILGMKRTEIVRKFDEIADFSGVEKFLDTPVKRYSSGMYLRLAFAVAAHLDPEILLVDEVLAVGDASFQEKCLGKMSEVARSGRTVLFVSHNMAAVRNLCSRALLLDRGEVQFQGTVDDAIHEYLGDACSSERSYDMTLAERQHRSGSGGVRAVSFQARTSGVEQGTPQTGCDAEFIVGYAARAKALLPKLHVCISVVDLYGSNVFTCTTAMTSLRNFRDVPPTGQVVCSIRNLPLIPGKYSVDLLIKDIHGLADSLHNAASFDVIDGGNSGLIALPSRRMGNIIVPHEWELLPAVAREDGYCYDTE